MPNKILKKLLFDFSLISFYLSLFLANLGLVSRVVLNNSIRFTIFEFVLYCFVLLIFLSLRQNVIKNLLKFKFLLLFLLYLWFNFIFQTVKYDTSSVIIAFLYLIRITVFFLLFPLLLIFFQQKYLVKQQVYSAIKLAFYLQIIFAAVQLIWYPNLRNLQHQGWDPHFYRLFSVYLDTYLANNIFVLFAFFSLYLNWRLLFLIFSISSVATFARAGIVFYSASLLFNKIISAKLKVLLVIAVAATALIFFSLNKQIAGQLLRSDTITSRLTDSYQAFSLFKNNPIFGVGFNFIGNYKSESYYPEVADLKPVYNAKSYFHNVYLTVAAASGIIGLILFLLMLVELFRFYNKPDILTYLYLYSFVDNVMFNVFVLFYLAVFLNLLKLKTNLI
ncbi:MAG: hypothetical protein KatS3mg091_457 [Patescibacteria group bacterium]|nr:MAG: hypothetical protein KatS3mg091_457 [Patescibacteria group bacterium]